MGVAHGNVDEELVVDEWTVPRSFWDGYPDAHDPSATTYEQYFFSYFRGYIPEVRLVSCSRKAILRGVWPTPALQWGR